MMLKRGVKAQFSMEFLMVVGFAFLFTVPLIALFYQQSANLTRDVVGSQVDKIVGEVRDAADEVYFLGSPSKKTVTIFIPKEVENITINDNFVSFLVDSPDGDFEVVKWSSANLTGSLSTFSGIHHVSVQSYDNYVEISE